MTPKSEWVVRPRINFILEKDRRALEDARYAAVQEWRDSHEPLADWAAWPPELLKINRSFFPPGSMYYCPWYFDPGKPELRHGDDEHATLDAIIANRIARIQANPNGPHHLSIHYWQDHAHQRPPLMIICPDYSHWCPDQKSSNGTGWKVTGELHNITVAPSIWTKMGSESTESYHGFLQNGQFTDPV